MRVPTAAEMHEMYDADALPDEPVPTILQVGAALAGAVIVAACIVSAIHRWWWAE